MNIVVLVRTTTRVGTERQLIALARGPRARGRRECVAVLCPIGPLEPDPMAAGIPALGAEKRGRHAQEMSAR